LSLRTKLWFLGPALTSSLKSLLTCMSIIESRTYITNDLFPASNSRCNKIGRCHQCVRHKTTRGSFWACHHATTSVLHSRHYIGCPFITGYSSRSHYSCTMHSLASVRSTSTTSWHLLPVTPVGSNYDLPPDPTSLFPIAEQSSAVVPSQQQDQKCGTVSRSLFGQQILSDSSDDYWKLTTSSCISVLTNSAVTVFNPFFILHTFYYYCNASRSGFVYRGTKYPHCIVLYCIITRGNREKIQCFSHPRTRTVFSGNWNSRSDCPLIVCSAPINEYPRDFISHR